MAIDNEKLITLGGLAEYHKSVPDTAKAAMLLMMSEADSLSEEPLIAQHVVGHDWITFDNSNRVKKLTVPDGAKYMVVDFGGGSFNSVAISNLTLYHSDSTYTSYTQLSDISSIVPISPFDKSNMTGPWTVANYPTIYISTSDESIASYQDSANFGLVNMPAGTFAYNADTKTLNCRADYLSEYGNGTKISEYDSAHANGTDPIIGICRMGMDAEVDPGFKTAIASYRNRNKFSGNNNSGIITVEPGTDYYLHIFNITSTGNAYANVFWFDNFGCARMASYDNMIDAAVAYKASHPTNS